MQTIPLIRSCRICSKNAGVVGVQSINTVGAIPQCGLARTTAAVTGADYGTRPSALRLARVTWAATHPCLPYGALQSRYLASSDARFASIAEYMRRATESA